MQRSAWAVFTNLDAFLDEGSSHAGAARPTIERLKAAGVPLIPVTSRTFEEVEPLAKELDFRHAMIVETGAAIAWLRKDGWEVENCGPDADAMLRIVSDIEIETGAHLSLYSVMKREDAARLSGLNLETVPKSQRRRCDEPFVISSGNVTDVVAAADRLGFAVRHDGRFFHLCGSEGVAKAMTRVREAIGCAIAVGIGSNAIDADFLLRTDIAVIVPGSGSRPDLELIERVPHARIAPAGGADGWVAAVETIRSEIVMTPQMTVVSQREVAAS